LILASVLAVLGPLLGQIHGLKTTNGEAIASEFSSIFLLWFQQMSCCCYLIGFGCLRPLGPKVANVSRETILPQATNKGFVVLVALIGGWTIQAKCRFSAQPIGLRDFDFELSNFP